MVEPATAGQRIQAYDLARTFAIVFVFLGHIIITQTTSSPLKVVFGTLSPGLTMSLLGFISAALLSTRANDAGVFLVRRFTRIYIPLFTCLAVVLIIQYAAGTAKTHTTDLVLHFLGLSGFFELFPHLNHASIGQGLWFVTTILSMYLLLPALQRVFAHRGPHPSAPRHRTQPRGLPLDERRRSLERGDRFLHRDVSLRERAS